VGHVLARHELNNLVTTIEDPCNMSAIWLRQFSPRRIRPQYDNIRDVVNTIFPIAIARRWPTRPEIYDRYLARHDRAARWQRNRSAWGSYFERLIRFPPSVNQLDRAIEKLRQWQTRSTTGLVFHLASPAIDTPRTRGGPCWHFGEILWKHDDVLDLVVVYRNHDFFNKALGNFIGLGQLLKFICAEAGKQPGKLICHSVHAYSGGSLRDLKELAT
jgi:hypothetical protein